MGLQAGDSRQLRELASGVDALYLSGRGKLADGLAARLEEGKALAVGTGGPIPFEVSSVTFAICPHGWGKYAYRLDHENGLVGFTLSKRLPAVRVQPRSRFLHALGPRNSVEWFRSVLAPHVARLRLSVSRVDLFADFQGWDLDPQERARFLSRARELVTHEEYGAFTGLEFGRRKSGTLVARIYEKVTNIKQKDTRWWYEVWGERYVSEERVLRIEAEFGRTVLRQFGLDTPEEVVASAARLWAYFTESWLTYRSPTEDQTRSRWPVSWEWEEIQRASLRHDATPLERVRESEQQASLWRVLPQLVGYLARFAVLMETDDVDATLERLLGHVEAYGASTGVSFAQRVERKRWAGSYA